MCCVSVSEDTVICPTLCVWLPDKLPCHRSRGQVSCPVLRAWCALQCCTPGSLHPLGGCRDHNKSTVSLLHCSSKFLKLHIYSGLWKNVLVQLGPLFPENFNFECHISLTPAHNYYFTFHVISAITTSVFRVCLLLKWVLNNHTFLECRDSFLSHKMCPSEKNVLANITYSF